MSCTASWRRRSSRTATSSAFAAMGSFAVSRRTPASACGKPCRRPRGVPVNADWRTRYDAAIVAARRAGDLALHYFDTSVAVEWKKDHSPVTQADRETESLIRTTLLKSFPHDGFLGEEQGEKPGASGFRW